MVKMLGSRFVLITVIWGCISVKTLSGQVEIDITIDFLSDDGTVPHDISAGDTYALECDVTVTGSSERPDIAWIGPLHQPVLPEMIHTADNVSTLTFRPLTTAHGGAYLCKVIVENITRMVSINVCVNIPTSMVTVTKDRFRPYNGTVFNLTGSLQLNETVINTDITIVWVWSLDGEQLHNRRTTSSTLQVTMTFEPLTMLSSGRYYLNLILLPIENSEYVIRNSNSGTFYDLMVEELPAPWLFIDVTNRSGDGCSEVMTLTCTATTVENVFHLPTITWFYEAGQLSNSSNPRTNPRNTGQLIFDGITHNNSGEYRCRASLTIPEAGIENHYREMTSVVTKETPGRVQNLMCSAGGAASPLNLTISWRAPSEGSTFSVAGGYIVNVQKLQYRHHGTHRELTSVPLAPEYYQEVNDTWDKVTQGLEAGVPYNITVKALSFGGCGQVQQLYCFAKEEVPPRPENVVATRLDSTSISVSWEKLTLVELKGLATYVVTYSTVDPSSKKLLPMTGMKNASWTENRVFILDLQPEAEHNVTVRIVNLAGSSVPVTVQSSERVATTISPSSSGNVAIVIGPVAVAIVLIIALTMTGIVVTATVRNCQQNRRREVKQSRSHEQDNVQPNQAMSWPTPHGDCENDYEVVDVDREYELVDVYEDAPTYQPLSQAWQSTAASCDYQPLWYGTQNERTDFCHNKQVEACVSTEVDDIAKCKD